MSPRLDLPVAIAVWVAGFAWLMRSGSWTPLAVGVVAAAARLVAADATTRRLLAPGLAPLGVGAAAGLAMIAVTYLAFPPLASASAAAVGGARDLYAALGAAQHQPATLVAVLGVVAASEEIVWRGRILARPSSATGSTVRLRDVARVLAHAVVYGGAHGASGSALLCLVAFLCGIAWGFVRVASGSLWPSVVAHVAWSSAVLVLWPLV
jgi:membrane protease YdiL (CAAX protease family)